MGDFAFGKEQRLLTAQDYRRVFEQADAKASHKHLLLLASRNQLTTHRLGLVIAKKHVRLAVNRNRIKRIAREVARTSPTSSTCMDVILLARPGMDRIDNGELSAILRQQWQTLTNKLCAP